MKNYATGLLLAAVLAAPGALSAQSAPQSYGSSSIAADPGVWGPYARLVGTRATSEKHKSSYEWRWEEGRTAIVEDQGEKWGSTRIVPLGGGKLARFVKDRHLWTGTVQADGSVVWAAEGNFLTRVAGDPYRVRIDGSKIVYEYVRMKNGAVEPTSLVVRLDDPQLTGARTTAGTSDVAAPVASPTRATASAPTRAATAPVAPAAPTSFGWLDSRIGRSFVGNRGDQVGQTLDVYREGDRLVLQLGLLAGGDLGRIVLRPGTAPGSLELLETWHTGSSNRVAYFVGSPSAPPTDPLDGYYGDPRVPGALVLEYDVPGAYIALTLKPGVNATSVVYVQSGGKRTLGVRRKIGQLDYAETGWFDITNKELVKRVIAHSDSEQLRLEQERQVEAASRADDEAYRMEHGAAAEQTRAAAAQALADSTARLNGTVASVQAQQAQQRLRTNPGAGSSKTTQDGSRGVASTTSGNAGQGAQAATRGAGAKAGSGSPLRFVMLVGLQPRAGDTVNPTCYSNVIVRPGPAGWGQGGSLPPGSEGAARRTVEGMKAGFIAACETASGRKVTSQGDFQWMWNEFRDGESQIANARARYREDVTVNL